MKKVTVQESTIIVKPFKSIFHKIIHDKRILNECIRNGGNLSKVAKENGITLATPV